MPMSVNAESLSQERGFSLGHVPAWAWLGAGVYLLLLVLGSSLLGDSDTFWHIAAGKWILDQHAFPSVDIYSFTKTGAPWISTSWLPAVLYAGSHDLAGRPGPLVLAPGSILPAFALLALLPPPPTPPTL